MNKLSKLIPTLTLSICIALLNGCAVIHFENGQLTPDPKPSFFDFSSDIDVDELNASSGKRYRKWYHHSIYQFAELSNALELSQECIGLDWNQVTTEVTPLDFVLGFVDNALFINASAIGIDLWSPWSIEYSCRTPY